MPPVQLNTDVALGVAIPSRNAPGRIAQLVGTVDAVLANHGYPPAIEQLLAEALTLTFVDKLSAAAAEYEVPAAAA